jgi:hypothetical protein
LVALLVALASLSSSACADDRPAGGAKGVTLRQDGQAAARDELEKRIVAAPGGAMTKPGLAGAIGGLHIRVIATDPQEVSIPVPQFVGGQVPLWMFVRAEPADAVAEFLFREREGGDVVLIVRLAGKKQDVKLTWAAAVLLTSHSITPDWTPAEPFRKASACAQAGADEITKLAKAVWPESGKPAEYATAIRTRIGTMKQINRPQSLDAVGILASGENGICTSNANLACALMRARDIPCRSVAVIPTIGQRLEMHRIAEYHDGRGWVPFDPSGVTVDIPAKPWQHVVMARTTVADEEAAMKPRKGAMPGCPYGQEAELLTPGVTLFGSDFFWSRAVPLAEFDVPEGLAKRAAGAWKRTLKAGTLSAEQAKAGAAKSAADLDKLKAD